MTMVATVHPWIGMCSVIESPVDMTEEQTESGLYVKHESFSAMYLKRGIIIEVAEGFDSLVAGASVLTAQDVVYYRESWQIGDLWIVRIGDIIAYEKADGS